MKKRMRRRGYENSENGQQKKISGKNDRLKRENKKRPTKAARKRPITIQQEWQTKTARSFNRNNEKLPRRPTKTARASKMADNKLPTANKNSEKLQENIENVAYKKATSFENGRRRKQQEQPQ